MRYAFESWVSPEPPPVIPVRRHTARVKAEAAYTPAEEDLSAFPFSEDMRELEESLSLGLEDVAGNAGADYAAYAELELYQSQTAAYENVQPQADEGKWDDLALSVAEYVLVHLRDMQHPLSQELEKQRRAADEYYRDNRAMAVQIRQLLDEREQLAQSLAQCQQELTRYHNVMGNLFLRS